ncbi:hypothetical protein [Aestuariirhabdus sp. LZHN29]|uniref:hypothetical protein n=1 Tax=Aestuariirhabdus sp. LZHN29 TaxID=3417462 RepID=UPI003CF3D6B9
MSSEKLWQDLVADKKRWFAEPFMQVFDENTLRIRRNLIALCAVVLTYKLAATGIDLEASSFVGIKLKGIKSTAIDWLLLIGVGYLFVHFLWSGWDKFCEWRLRLTGMVLPKPKNDTIWNDGEQGEAGADSPEQATLSGWWMENTKQYLDSDLANEHKLDFDGASAKNIPPAVNLIKQRIEELSNKGAHIEAALQRYETGFDMLQASQRWRWFILEFSLPIGMALVAIGLLLGSTLFCSAEVIQ